MEEEHLHLHVPLVEPVAAVAPSAASNAASAPALPRGLKARGAPSSRTQMSTLVSMTVDPVRHLVERMLQSPSVHLFGENTVQYVLSRQWKDLIAIYCFRLQPLPYCSHEQDERIACSTPAAAWVQALFAVAMLLAAVALTSISIPLEEKYPKVRVLTVTLPHLTPPYPTLPHPTPPHPKVRVLPKMAGMCVGWCFGDASTQLLTELGGSPKGLPWSNFAFTAVETVLAASILASSPAVVNGIAVASRQVSHKSHTSLTHESHTPTSPICHSHISPTRHTPTFTQTHTQ